VTACVPAFFWTNMSFEMKTRQPASQDSLLWPESISSHPSKNNRATLKPC
jgi:hypothetical protein